MLRASSGAIWGAIALSAAVCATAQAQETEQSAPESSAAPSTPAAPASTQTVPVTLPDEDKAATQLEEVVVTSTKRAKSQRDIPGSVSALRGEDLEKMQAQGMKDYLKLVPGVVYIDEGDEGSLPIIRGISSDIFFGDTPGTTGVYMDDMPFADLFAGAQSIPDLNPFDLDRVEVLKGPQGTLFGSGALAGAIRYIVEKPHFDLWETKFAETVSRTEFSGAMSPVTAGAVNIPIGDTLAIRLVGVLRKDAGLYDIYADQCTPQVAPIPTGITLPDLPLAEPGFVRNGTTPNVAPHCTGTRLRDAPDADALKQTSLRGMIAWHPLERLNLSAMYFDQRSKQNDFGLSDFAGQFKRDQAPFPSPQDHAFAGGNLTLSYDFDWAKLLSSTNRMEKHNYTDTHEEFGFDAGGQNQSKFMNILATNVLGWTQEVRLSSPESKDSLFEWLIGASYLHWHDSTWQFITFGQPTALGDDPRRETDVTEQEILLGQVFSTSAQLATEKALFGEVTFRPSHHWEFAAGARRYKTGLDAVTLVCGAQITALFPQTLLTSNGCFPDQIPLDSQGLNPKLSIRYIHNRNVQWYALAAKGFQFGGIQINPPSPVFTQTTQQAGYKFAPYKSSNLWNYETGLRTEWLDRRVRFDITFYYLDWKDLQLTVLVPDPVTNTDLFGIIANVGRAHSVGIETAFEARPLPGLTWTTTTAWMNAVTDVVFDRNNPVDPGTRLPGSPKFQMANVLAYEHALPYFHSWTIAPTLTHSHLGIAPDQIQPTGTVGGYDTIDARLAFADRASRFVPELSLGMNNITDVRGVSVHSQTKAPTQVTFDFYHYVTPRTLVASLSFKF